MYQSRKWLSLACETRIGIGFQECFAPAAHLVVGSDRMPITAQFRGLRRPNDPSARPGRSPTERPGMSLGIVGSCRYPSGSTTLPQRAVDTPWACLLGEVTMGSAA